MNSRAYRATRVNDVDWDRLATGNDGLGIALGVDIGKSELLAVCRWAGGRFERPWRAHNPEEVPTLVALIRRMITGRELVVAMESSGTYGDALRQALSDAKIAVVRVSNKASRDYAEVFDGVPSQHDGKDAAVIADLAALGKARPWAYEAPSNWEQELA
jgi:transposase